MEENHLIHGFESRYDGGRKNEKDDHEKII